MQFSRKLLLQEQIPYVEVLDTDAGEIKTVLEPGGIYLLESVAGGGSGGQTITDGGGGGGNGRYRSAVIRCGTPFRIAYKVGAGGDIETGNGGNGGVGTTGGGTGGKGGSGGHISWVCPQTAVGPNSGLSYAEKVAFRSDDGEIIYLDYLTSQTTDSMGINGASITLQSKVSSEGVFQSYVCEVIEKWKTVKYGEKTYTRYVAGDQWGATAIQGFASAAANGGGGGGGEGGQGEGGRYAGGAGGGAGGGLYVAAIAADTGITPFVFEETSVPGRDGPSGGVVGGAGLAGVAGNQDFTVYSGAGGNGYRGAGGAKATGGGASGGSGGGGKSNDDDGWKRRSGGGGGGAGGDSTAGCGQGGLSLNNTRAGSGDPYRTTGAQGISPDGERVDAAYGAGGAGGSNPGFSGWVSIKRIA